MTATNRTMSAVMSAGNMFFLSFFSLALLYRVPPKIAKPTSEIKMSSMEIPWKTFMESLYKL